MIVGIHQPNHLPYLGFFDKMNKADIFVIHDDAQFNKHEFQHRNRIRVEKGWQYLIVPVYKEELSINQIKLEFQDFEHLVYKQRYEGFVPNMAAIDALFNVGEMPDKGNEKPQDYSDFHERALKTVGGCYNG